MDQQTMNTIIITVLVPLSTAMVGFICAWFKKKTDEINSRVKNQTVNKYIGDASKLVTDSVIAIQQSYVDTLKKNGEWNEDSQKAAFNQAKSKVLNLITEESKSAVQEIAKDYTAWIDNKIEKNVAWIKKDSGNAAYID